MTELERLVDVAIQFGQMRVLVNREPIHWHVHEFLRLAGEMNEQKSRPQRQLRTTRSKNI